MLFPFPMSSADNFASLFVYDYLGLKCVFFLFPTKELFLFFFGRSLGGAVTSTTTNLILLSGVRRVFFPGRVKVLEVISVSSILRIIRYAVDSFTPQD